MKVNGIKRTGFENNDAFIVLHNEEFLEKQRYAGKVVAETLLQLAQSVSNKDNDTLLEFDRWADDFIVKSKCTPTFKNYGSGKNKFPNAVCISVDSESLGTNTLVHGIPTDYRLQDGDIVKFDLGATYQGCIADSALTFIFGEPRKQEHKQLIKDTQQSLYAAIKAIEVGKRLGVIGHTIYNYGHKKDYGVISTYGGHGISITKEKNGIAHAQPFVNNKSEKNDGIVIQPGLSIAIEPMFVLGDITTKVAEDGWSVRLGKGTVSSHFEHTLFIHEEKVEVITQRSGEIII